MKPSPADAPSATAADIAADDGDPFGANADDIGGARVLDVRRAAVYEHASSTIAGASWYDPATVGQWAEQLPTDVAYVVYCVHGHEVSRNTAERLRAAGLKARHLRGGISQWEAEGRPLQARSA